MKQTSKCVQVVANMKLTFVEHKVKIIIIEKAIAVLLVCKILFITCLLQ